MKTNSVLLAVAFALVAMSSPVRADDPPEEIKKVMTELEKDAKAIEAKIRKEMQARMEKAVKQMQDVEAAYLKAGKKDEAAAAGGVIKSLQQEIFVLTAGIKVLENPGILTAYRGKNDEVFYFRVTGSTDGEVWGTGLYTDDSPLAAAAVHAGVVKKGETAIVKVTILAGESSYTGSTANEVTTSEFGQWEGSYKVEVVKAEKK